MKVKICGIRTVEAAKTAMLEGADFLGFNFVRSSSRYIDPSDAYEIIGKLPANVKVVGVFANEKKEKIRQAISEMKLDFVQLHGNERPQECALTQYAGVIKAFRVPSHFDDREFTNKASSYDVDYIMADRVISGEMLDLYKVQRVARVYRLFLAGGLTPGNVTDAIRIARPYAVDVASGVETNGKQDLEKIKEFINNAKSM